MIENTTYNLSQPEMTIQAARQCTESCINPAWPEKAAFFTLLVTLFLAYLDIEYGGSEETPVHVRYGLHIATLFSLTALGIILFKLGGA
ncbi:hypothetical protein SAMN05443574_12427 [Haloarcula vallismortis]|uniref:Uncharacterized protein n=2 Tax=Haloarcula vallismortis TaxID=28442 RepID=M0JLQ4_HALVA|nr:hypothetical protein [Haloarcula vallismortis]EMA09941.1 hypothetical protein C437_04770 [Haloarcula vallismortis ATCC 29715]SDX28134.1 hypothetical protein SAMN05443574_12427 [Haloarcula vallismortis]